MNRILVSGRLQQADSAAVQITLCMTLEEWKKLEKLIVAAGNSWPYWKLADAIGKVIRSIDKNVNEVLDEEP
jgi:hypothetical protein